MFYFFYTFLGSGPTGSPTLQPRVFVTVPRILPGNPASIAEVVPGHCSDCYLLAPYPDWQTNTILDENHIDCKKTIVSVFRTKVSEQYYNDKPLKSN